MPRSPAYRRPRTRRPPLGRPSSIPVRIGSRARAGVHDVLPARPCSCRPAPTLALSATCGPVSLTAGGVSPGSGTPATTFTFTVTYTNALAAPRRAPASNSRISARSPCPAPAATPGTASSTAARRRSRSGPGRTSSGSGPTGPGARLRHAVRFTVVAVWCATPTLVHRLAPSHADPQADADAHAKPTPTADAETDRRAEVDAEADRPSPGRRRPQKRRPGPRCVRPPDPAARRRRLRPRRRRARPRTSPRPADTSSASPTASATPAVVAAGPPDGVGGGGSGATWSFDGGGLAGMATHPLIDLVDHDLWWRAPLPVPPPAVEGRGRSSGRRGPRRRCRRQWCPGGSGCRLDAHRGPAAGEADRPGDDAATRAAARLRQAAREGRRAREDRLPTRPDQLQARFRPLARARPARPWRRGRDRRFVRGVPAGPDARTGSRAGSHATRP